MARANLLPTQTTGEPIKLTFAGGRFKSVLTHRHIVIPTFEAVFKDSH